MTSYKLPQISIDLDKSRKCGKCTACCTVLGVPELEKKHQTPCVYEKTDSCGCSIYDDRPATCKGFYCAWRLGLGTYDDRPDKIGVVFAYQLGTKFAKRLLVVDEVRPKACLEARPYAMIATEALRQLVLVRSGATRKLVGPNSELDRVQPLVGQAMKDLYGPRT